MTKKKTPLTTQDGDALPLTPETVRSMRPMRELDPEMSQRFTQEKQKRGRPAGRSKAVVSLSLDKDLIAELRGSGKGWQSRVNALLRTAMGLGKPEIAAHD